MAQIRRSGQQAAALTRQLLAFARRQIRQPVVLDLNSAISDLGTMLSRLLGEDVTSCDSLAHDVRRVRVDLAQIEQVIVNLAVNARDAMPRGGELRIETTNVAIGATPQPAVSLPAGTYVLLAVSDTGEGIPDDVLGHMFEPFFTTKAMGQGTGLGLATVHGIIKQSGGDILVRTAPSRGTTFTIYLPATDAPLPLDDSVVLADARTAVPGTVLLIEDDDAVREFAREVLRSRGWRVVEAPGPAEALAICTEGTEAFDVVVTDVVMPGLSGGELADRLEVLRPGCRCSSSRATLTSMSSAAASCAPGASCSRNRSRGPSWPIVSRSCSRRRGPDPIAAVSDAVRRSAAVAALVRLPRRRHHPADHHLRRTGARGPPARDRRRRAARRRPARLRRLRPARYEHLRPFLERRD